MDDRERVIDAFERCFCTESAGCPGCYLEGPGFGYECRVMLCRDALELLKAQEPVEAKVMGESKSHGSWWFACGACGHAIDPKDNFCRECGRAVKWNE